MSDSAVQLRLLRLRKISGQIEVMTGLRIGTGLPPAVGVVDYPVARSVGNDEPYIPGSSLKGKMRHLLEWHLGRVRQDGSPWHIDDGKCAITQVFGGPASGQHASGPMRLIVRDARLSEPWQQALATGSRPVVEIKFENSINRLTAEATGRPVERVVPGVRFDYELLYRVFDTGDGGAKDEQLLQETVLLGLALIEQDCLGASGSRGYGQVRFVFEQDGEATAGVLVDGEPVRLPSPSAPAEVMQPATESRESPDTGAAGKQNANEAAQQQPSIAADAASNEAAQE